MTIIYKYIEVIQQILPLLNTIEEGILHTKHQLAELRYEQALVMFQDVMEGIASIENAIYPMKNELPKNDIESLFIALKEGINNAISSYEHSKETNIENQISEEVLPAFLTWKQEMEKVLKPYAVS